MHIVERLHENLHIGSAFDCLQRHGELHFPLLIDVARLNEKFAVELGDAASAQFFAEGFDLLRDAVKRATDASEIEIS